MLFAGIDIGSYYAKALLTDENGREVSRAGTECGPFFGQAAAQVADEACAAAGAEKKDISAVLTGIGSRGVAGQLGFASERTVTDISCQARACSVLFPTARTVIDIGGGSSKAVCLDTRGCCRRFVCSEKCAAGSGRFMQIIAGMLELDIAEIGAISLLGDDPISFTTGCAVFAESDVITKIGEGVSAANILAGMNKAIASKTGSLAKRVGFEPDCVVTGGAARNAGLTQAIGLELGTAILVPDSPEYSCALGAALIAMTGFGREQSNV